MIKVQCFVISILSVFLVTASKSEVSKVKSEPSELNARIDRYINDISERYNIPGVSLAVIKDGKILHKRNYGKSNLEHSVPVSDASVFRVYSLTKPIVATAIFQLIEKNRLSLEDPVSKFLTDLPSSWQKIKVANLLRHSSGLPEIKVYDKLPEPEAKEKVYKDAIQFQQGTRSQYNQTNYWLLLRIIEELSKKKFEDFILENQFKNIGKTERVFFSTDSRDIHKDRVSLYFPYETGEMQTVNHYRGDYLTAANGLNINLNGFVKWNSNFVENKLITTSSKNEMWKPTKFHNVSRIWTYGWNQHNLNGHRSYGFSGSMVTAYRHFPDHGLSIIYLTNGFEHWYDIEEVVNHIAYMVDDDIIDQEVLVYETLLSSARKNVAKLTEDLDSLKGRSSREVDYENALNKVGYVILENYEDTERAIRIFKLIVQEFPQSSNAFDSLGEAFERKNDYENAILNYQKACDLSTDENYRMSVGKKVKKLRKRLPKKQS